MCLPHGRRAAVYLRRNLRDSPNPPDFWVGRLFDVLLSVVLMRWRLVDCQRLYVRSVYNCRETLLLIDIAGLWTDCANYVGSVSILCRLQWTTILLYHGGSGYAYGHNNDVCYARDYEYITLWKSSKIQWNSLIELSFNLTNEIEFSEYLLIYLFVSNHLLLLVG